MQLKFILKMPGSRRKQINDDLWVIVAALMLPGILLMALNEKGLYKEAVPEIEPPPFYLRLVNHMILAFPFAALGLFFYKRAGFHSPVFIQGVDGLSLLLGLLCALFNVAVYYLFFKKKTTAEIFEKLEKTRQQVWISTRCLYGGIVEEVIFRFGLMSFFVWAGNFVTDQPLLSVWIANLLASILFALAHLPAVYQMKISVTKPILFYSVGMNMVVGLTCGWLYWDNDLTAAVLCHMLFHLVWYGFEKIGHK
ncbi:CPBP family intramembrane metalloprotease [Rossellomorea vietnamensis]|uniref:CPBP family intramembrane metalloprotease n=1 Tax=Rossellomorea vietnamensis TaxID=218284 RepID=A0A5D4NYF8_9BACI|nr:CPBP family intramembrane glutamic endopeptidase [Rossellomorea vietnamensis]TYS18504.1 CPBP family intramembrane metalloprotease [Rossellomorea vietnamensis]